MVCHCSIPDGLPPHGTTILDACPLLHPAKAEEALDAALSPADGDDEKVLFDLRVTKAWLRQLILGMTLICHSSLRGAVELLGDVFDYPISVGTVHNVLQAAVAQARSCNEQRDLGGVRIGAHDEIFQSGRPVLVGGDAESSYCYLLSLEAHRDGPTRSRSSATSSICLAS
jgi:hypothetical protein